MIVVDRCSKVINRFRENKTGSQTITEVNRYRKMWCECLSMQITFKKK